MFSHYRRRTSDQSVNPWPWKNSSNRDPIESSFNWINLCFLHIVHFSMKNVEIFKGHMTL